MSQVASYGRSPSRIRTTVSELWRVPLGDRAWHRKVNTVSLNSGEFRYGDWHGSCCGSWHDHASYEYDVPANDDPSGRGMDGRRGRR